LFASIKSTRKYFSQKILFLLIAAAVGAGVIVFLSQGSAQSTTYDGPPRAVIIDQLYDEMPNKSFHAEATKYLNKAGYEVDIVTTKDVTVDFYKNLPKMHYKYVIVRTHGAQNSQDVVLFTGEKYTEDRYISEQLLGQVKRAAPLLEVAYMINADGKSKWEKVNDTYSYITTTANPVKEAKDEYFAISADLVNHAMNGRFDDTIFLLGGCNTLANPSLAKSLTDRGASLVVGWDNTVSNSDNDLAILSFLKGTLQEDMDIKQTLEQLPQNKNPGLMAYPANFTYYPQA
jgi:hypothetical protein